MEQKINGMWCDPEKMRPEALEQLRVSCWERIERTHEDLEVLEGEIGKRILGGEQMEFDLVKELPYEEVQDGAQN